MTKVVASKGEWDTAMGEEELWATLSFQNLNSLWSVDMDSALFAFAEKDFGVEDAS